MPSFVDLDGLRTFKEHLNLSGGGNAVTDTATSSVAGLTKLYDELGNATDGAVTQSAVTKFVNAKRYGYRIKKTESEPYERVEYLFDAAAMTPAKMDFENGVFDYESWADVWFVKDNKPCAMNNEGEVEFYLDPNDYTSMYSAGAYYMAQFPLVWVYRYEDDDYYYEIVANYQPNENYKAYAHTDANGDIKDYFYHSIFPASTYNDTAITKFNSKPAGELTAAQQLSSLQSLGTNWRLTSWSQYQLIRTLLILISKSTNTQAVFGNGNETSASLQTGTLADKGQFFGYNDFTHQVKVFHVEDLWGNYWIRLEGLLKQGNGIFCKMTPDYSFTDKTIYQSDLTVSGSDISASPITAMSVNNNWGMFPKNASGSTSTYFCDLLWWSTSSNLCSAVLVGKRGSRYSQTGGAGVFALDISNTPSYTGGDLGFCISYV